MTHSIRNLAALAGLGIFLGGCGGYGDEVEGKSQMPPLVMMKEVNAWLEAYKAQHGTVLGTYEEVKAAYEATGKPWPPFPDGGTWAYFPGRARIIEVRESWVNRYLKYLSRKVEESGRHVYSLDAAEQVIRKQDGVSALCPGYRIVYVYRGSVGYLAIATAEDGITLIRENHTANEDFDIGNDGLIVAVPRPGATPTP